VGQNRTSIALTPLRLTTSLTAKPQGPDELIIALYRQFGEKIFAWLQSECHSKADAEEITQATFLKLHEALSHGTTIEVPEAWLYTVARRLLIDHIRSRANAATKHAVADQTGVFQRDVQTPEEALIERRRQEAVRKALGELTDLERRCVLERAQGRKVREIAAIVGLNHRRVSEEIARAVKKLEKATSHE
jgi:RNA polymerase sigma-70 factor, ECF subfamily